MAIQLPSPGRIVTVRGLESNGSSQQPAIITRLWGTYGDTLVVNLTVIPDDDLPYPRPNVPFFQTSEEAEASGHPVCCFWPDRV